MNSYYHAVSSSKKWGGTPETYIDIHEFIDSSKKIIGDVRHRSLYHHTEGVWLCQRIFGRTVTLDGGKQVPVRLIAERHIQEDLGWLPSPKDYIDGMVLKQWMGGAVRTERSLTEVFPKQQYLDQRPRLKEASYCKCPFAIPHYPERCPEKWTPSQWTDTVKEFQSKEGIRLLYSELYDIVDVVPPLYTASTTECIETEEL